RGYVLEYILLETGFNEKEVWDAIRGCGGDKAPRPDGFNFKFIRIFWDIIKSNSIEAVMWFWEKMEISRGCNASFVTIIPKYQLEILAKHYENNGVVEVCLRSSFMSILVNESPTEEFELERDVRQGDHLSPFLFILAAEGLNAIVNEAVEKEWNKENAKALMCILKCFEKVSGLKVNYNKSKLYGIGVNDEELVDMARWMGCGIGEFLFTYLGLPIGIDRDGRFLKIVSSRSRCFQVWSRKRIYRWKVELVKRYGTSWRRKSLVTFDLAMSVWDKVFSWWKLGSVIAFSIGFFFHPVEMLTFLVIFLVFGKRSFGHGGTTYGRKEMLVFLASRFQAQIKLFKIFNSKATNGL
nr:transposon TX1 uncharacterized [Tanacetum cinerariifolium]